MDYRLLYHPAGLKEDLTVIPSGIKLMIKNAIEMRLLKDPISFGKPLRQSLKGHRKFRVGDWRVIYRIEKKDIFILKIGHLKDVYQKVVTIKR
ncbi:MAG: type II toxin-antitoxin system RelE/ParE family toxin [Candidatus Ancaeobacter aquaticus]|nr:type II toxin-antitoxin system RelE/ParE family toxin [Candidatus Ancaeobacter aquaticus]